MYASKPGKVLLKPTQNTNRRVRPPPQTPHLSLILLAVFRDQLYKHLETVPEGDFDAFANKLVLAGGSLELLKYADVLFEILLVGGLLQPGGSYIDDGAPMSPFSVFNAKEPVEVSDVKKYVEVLNNLIRRYVFREQYVHRRFGLIRRGRSDTSISRSLSRRHLSLAFCSTFTAGQMSSERNSPLPRGYSCHKDLPAVLVSRV